MLFPPPSLRTWGCSRCSRRSGASRVLVEPPYTEPHVRWCGRAADVNLPPTRLDFVEPVAGHFRARHLPRSSPMTINVGDRMPEGKFKVMSDGCPKDLTAQELFNGKRGVLFSVPGAFTPTCNAKHLPG